MSADWVIRKSGYFYRPNRSGYTPCIAEAGRYTEAEARAEAAIEPSRMSAHPASEFDGIGIRWQRVNDEPFEYAIQQGPHGDEFVKLFSGSCLRRALGS